MKTIKEIKEIQALIETAFGELNFTGEPKNLYDPINYILGLGGKKTRPALYLMAYQLFREDLEKALPGAMAIEVFHNFTLMHDDIMDNAPQRRGQTTVHEKWNANMAILSGDVMLVEAYKLILKIDSENKLAILELFNQAAIMVCEGQQMDMNFEKEKHVSIEQYVRMIELKTAVLLAYSLKIGAVQAGANEADAQHLYAFGRNIGIAFQLQDDYLDCFGEHAKVGKQIGGDILANKKTFLWIKALELGNPQQKDALSRWESMKDFDASQKINEVKEIFTQLKLDQLIQKEILHYSEAASIELEKIQVNSTKKSSLMSFSDELKVRRN